MKKPVILVTTGIMPHPMNQEHAFVVEENYMEAIRIGGGIPVLAGSSAIPEDYAEMADGLVLTGGGPPHPRYFGSTFSDIAENDLKNMRVMASESNTKRDNLEFPILDAFVKRKKPVLGICRGYQILNVYTGGKMQLNFAYKHGVEHQCGVIHDVEATPDSVLGQIFGEKFLVNSYHWNVVSEVSDDWNVTARSQDGIVEGVQHKTLPMIGTQFHLERMCGPVRHPAQGPDSTPFFQYFVSLCQK